MLHEIDIQPDDRVVFMHIPKTAGITFSTILHPLVAELPWCPVILPENLFEMPYEDLWQYQLFTGHFRFRLANKLFPSGFVGLTFLREPISRTISHYEFLLRQETFGNFDYANEQLALVKKMSLKEFASNNQLHLAVDIIDTQTKFLSGKPISRSSNTAGAKISREAYDRISKSIKLAPPPANELPVADQESLEDAKKCLEQIAFFGITERFQDSLFLMCFIFGWPPVLDSIHLNGRPTGDRTQKPDEETLDVIRSKVSLDLELYEFGQALFEQRFSEMTEILLERYAGQVAADLSQPLTQDVLFALLQKHYEACRNRRNQKVLRMIGQNYLYTPGQHAEGNFGWHVVEISDAHGTAVWSGPGVESGFDLPCPRGRNIQVSFRVLMAIQIENIRKLSLKVNNIPINLNYGSDSMGAYIFTGVLPPEAISGSFLRFVFWVPSTIAPKDISKDNQDPRKLGFLLNWLKLEARETIRN